MRITVVGCGSIGSRLAKAADGMDEVKRIYLVDRSKEKAEKVAEGLKKGIVVDDVDDELYHTDLVVEASSQDSARRIAPRVVGRGVDIMLMSVGALVDDSFRESLFQTANEHEARIYIPAGAICGTDGLRAASDDRLDSVELVAIRRPTASEPAERRTVFSGTAREAVKAYPKNVNVAATVAILGIGFDRTRVEIIVDPAAEGNTYELRYSGAFGSADARTVNAVEAENPSTSHIGVLSAVEALKRVCRNEWAGIR